MRARKKGSGMLTDMFDNNVHTYRFAGMFPVGSPGQVIWDVYCTILSLEIVTASIGGAKSNILMEASVKGNRLGDGVDERGAMSRCYQSDNSN